MTAPSQRGLQQWEQIGFSMNVSLYFELHGHVSKETLCQSYKALQAEHPVLGMGIEYCDNVPTFVTLSDPTLRLETTSALYPKWQSKLQEFANEFRDWGEALTFMELASSGDQHQLFLTINHAGRPCRQPGVEPNLPEIFPMTSVPHQASTSLQVLMASACSTCAAPCSQIWACSLKVSHWLPSHHALSETSLPNLTPGSPWV